MAKYGIAKYGLSKYGRYELEVPSGIDLSQLIKFRLRSVGRTESRPIVNSSLKFETSGSVKVRLKIDNNPWVYQQSQGISGELLNIRIKSVGASESLWVESVVGTLKGK